MQNDKMRVLLVDDDSEDFETARELVEGILGDDYELEWQKDYASGMAALRSGRYIACLLDYRLGGRTGLDFLKEAAERGNSVPVILFTSSGDRGMEKSVLAAGAADFLVKGETDTAGLWRALRFATERNLAMHAGRERDRFRAIFDGALEAMLVSDDAGHIVDANAAAWDLTGLSRAAILGKIPFELGRVGPDDASTRAAWAAFLAAGRSSGEFEVLRPDGTVRMAEYTATARILPGRHLSVLRDVTEQKKLQARLVVSDRMASVGTMAAGVAHEINNPLATVVGYLEMAGDALKAMGRAENGDVLDMLKHAGESAQRVRQTVKDLKLFSRPDERRNGCVDLRAILESSLRMAWNEIRHRARVVKDYEEVPFIAANESRMGQIFLNLLVNAAQAIPPGHVERNEIRISLKVKGGDVEVAVHDTGAGMLPAELDRIFEIFYSTKVAAGGTGLGLAICKGIADQMGARISVESRPGVGSSFTLRLPLSLACEPPAEPATPKAEPAQGRRGRVLVVDDEADLLEVMRAMLSREHEVTSTGDPREALKRIAAGEAFDAILCDMMMPQMTGMDFYRELEKSHPALLPKLIFISGGAFSPGENDFMEASPAYIEKPFGRAELSAAVRAMVGP
jgi:PAS domain S-box-containing protein